MSIDFENSPCTWFSKGSAKSTVDTVHPASTGQVVRLERILQLVAQMKFLGKPTGASGRATQLTVLTALE